MFTFKSSFSVITGILFQLTVIFAKKADLEIPPGLSIGAGTSAYQIEGAWNISDKGESIWDHYTHQHPEKILNGDNGDIACDSYHNYREDIKYLKKMNMTHYRFSLSWTRILPKGYANVISKDGVRYYNNLINELIENGIEPYVTLYHFDHPQIFEEIGGWTNEAIVDLFGDYARVVYKEFGDRVKTFATINEPAFCHAAYIDGYFAPGLKERRHAAYLCGHNTLKAHARAYHIYNDEFRAKQNGKIGIVLGCDYSYPKNKNDTQSAEIAFQFNCGRYANPIFSKHGDYPEIVKKRIAENSKFEGLQRSRLPTFSNYWINYIRGTADYFGLNHYSSKLVEPAKKSNNTIYENDDGLAYSYDPKWISSASERIKIVPSGFGDTLRLIKEKFENPPIVVSENGVSDLGTLTDTQRIEYIYLYIESMLTAIKKDGCNVIAYTYWSLLDNFEWASGYSEHFGLIHVNFNDSKRTRTPKKSVAWISSVLKNRRLEKPLYD